MKKRLSIIFLPISLIALAGCDNPKDVMASLDKNWEVWRASSSSERWYTQDQVTRGNAPFQENCASCHKSDASGTLNWRETDAQGKLPPPPINGTAHAWHHPLSVLRRTVRVGGVPLGGSMPGFDGKLDSGQIDDILAWVQSHWPDDIYGVWHERNIQEIQ
ncbi:MAG: cytochrome c [Gammaproteobacteria bacterium]|nr:cytochrome c [Gammaproteobacteria bacterium]